MSEQAASTPPNLTTMEFVPASHFLKADETIAIAGFGVSLPETGDAPQPESDIDRLFHGCATVSIDVYGEHNNDRIEVRDVSNTPWVNEETGERGNFLAAQYAMGNRDRLELQRIHRLQPGEHVGLNDGPASEASSDPGQQATEGHPLSIEVSHDGQLHITNHSPSYVVRVRNLGQTGKLIQRPLSSPAPELAAQHEAIADTETGQPVELTEAGLPKRVPRQQSAIGALGMGSEAQLDTASEPPAEQESGPKHALRGSEEDWLTLRTSDADTLGSPRAKQRIGTINIPRHLLDGTMQQPKPEEN